MAGTNRKNNYVDKSWRNWGLFTSYLYFILACLYLSRLISSKTKSLHSVYLRLLTINCYNQIVSQIEYCHNSTFTKYPSYIVICRRWNVNSTGQVKVKQRVTKDTKCTVLLRQSFLNSQSESIPLAIRYVVFSSLWALTRTSILFTLLPKNFVLII